MTDLLTSWEVEDTRDAEALRLTLRRELRVLGQRMLAGVIGISRGALRGFLDMSEPGEVVMTRIREWCADRPMPNPPAPLIGLALLAMDFPSSTRPRVRRQIAAALRQAHGELGLQPPAWLIVELGEPE